MTQEIKYHQDSTHLSTEQYQETGERLLPAMEKTLAEEKADLNKIIELIILNHEHLKESGFTIFDLNTRLIIYQHEIIVKLKEKIEALEGEYDN